MSEFGVAPQVLEQIVSAVGAVSEIRKAIIFGSRARGDFHPRSDIDIAIDADTDVLAKLQVRLDDVETILKIDVADLGAISNENLRANIQRDGKVIFDRRGGDIA